MSTTSFAHRISPACVSSTGARSSALLNQMVSAKRAPHVTGWTEWRWGKPEGKEARRPEEGARVESMP
jgi:hypothetical protein